MGKYHPAYLLKKYRHLCGDCQGKGTCGGVLEEGIGGINGDGRRPNLGWWIHNIVYRWRIVELCTWNLYNFVKQCCPNKFNKNEKMLILGPLSPASWIRSLEGGIRDPVCSVHIFGNSHETCAEEVKRRLNMGAQGGKRMSETAAAMNYRQWQRIATKSSGEEGSNCFT